VGKTQLSSLEANIDRFTKLLHDTKEIYKNGFAEKLDENKVNAFCNIPNILNNRHLIENKGKIQHFFEIGIRLVEQIE
jgi:hypothetical protein